MAWVLSGMVIRDEDISSGPPAAAFEGGQLAVTARGTATAWQGRDTLAMNKDLNNNGAACVSTRPDT
eukprot:scaffold79193_cov63-Phaeocystis_antarctica.AAC.2